MSVCGPVVEPVFVKGGFGADNSDPEFDFLGAALVVVGVSLDSDVPLALLGGCAHQNVFMLEDGQPAGEGRAIAEICAVVDLLAVHCASKHVLDRNSCHTSSRHGSQRISH